VLLLLVLVVGLAVAEVVLLPGLDAGELDPGVDFIGSFRPKFTDITLKALTLILIFKTFKIHNDILLLFKTIAAKSCVHCC
jgi:hypothetical protein